MLVEAIVLGTLEVQADCNHEHRPGLAGSQRVLGGPLKTDPGPFKGRKGKRSLTERGMYGLFLEPHLGSDFRILCSVATGKSVFGLSPRLTSKALGKIVCRSSYFRIKALSFGTLEARYWGFWGALERQEYGPDSLGLFL